MSVVTVQGRTAIESFGPVFATLGTLVLNSAVFPAVEKAAVLEAVGTVGGLLDTVPGNVWVSRVGVLAFTGAPPNTILVRVVTSDGDYTGTLSSVKVLVQGP
jgi:hypothetical protein